MPTEVQSTGGADSMSCTRSGRLPVSVTLDASSGWRSGADPEPSVLCCLREGDLLVGFAGFWVGAAVSGEAGLSAPAAPRYIGLLPSATLLEGKMKGDKISNEGNELKCYTSN